MREKIKTAKSREWVGRWVRFYNAGKIVIGCVQYASENKYDGEIELSTDAGTVSPEYVLEWREARTQ